MIPKLKSQPLIVLGVSGLNGQNVVQNAVVAAKAGAERWTLNQKMVVSNVREEMRKIKNATSRLAVSL